MMKSSSVMGELQRNLLYPLALNSFNFLETRTAQGGWDYY